MGSRERSKNCVDFPSPFDPKELKMASGVQVAEDVKIKYDEIKKRKTHRYCVFYIKDEKLIAVEKIAGRDSSYEDFLSDLMSWCPDTARIKKKMLYSSSFDALKKCLVGVQKYIQATDESEASAEEVEEILRKTDRI